MSPEAVPAYDVEVLTGLAAREAARLLQVGCFTPPFAISSLPTVNGGNIAPLTWRC